MTLSPIRKWLNIGFGLVLFVFVGVLLWPLIGRPFELLAFCAGLQPGISGSNIRDLSDQHGFKMSSQSNGIAHVYDFQSFGKFSCTLRMHGDELAESTFGFSD